MSVKILFTTIGDQLETGQVMLMMCGESYSAVNREQYLRAEACRKTHPSAQAFHFARQQLPLCSSPLFLLGVRWPLEALIPDIQNTLVP